jgi:subtilase family serine protease
MHRIVSATLPAFFVLGFASAASARLGPLELSDGTYHRAVCAHIAGPAARDHARCHAHLVTDSNGRITVDRVRADGTPEGYGPSDLRSAYKIAAGGGTRTVLAIVDAYGYTNAEADLAKYRAQYGLPPCTTANGCFKKLNQAGLAANYPAQNLGWAQESALDLDMASSMCPNCKLVLVEANSTSFSDFEVAEETAAAQRARAISNSYGGSETGSETLEAAYDHPGVAVTASTGDSGYGVEFPASSPHVIAVGGTTLKKAGTSRGWSETAWSGAGSGCSKVYAKPSWQRDAGCSKRTVADVSAVANPNTPVAVYGPASATTSGWLLFGGTSAAAPLIAGIYAASGDININAASNLYAHSNALFGVTKGSNGVCSPAYLCTAEPGYDGPTGLGTPDGTGAF